MNNAAERTLPLTEASVRPAQLGDAEALHRYCYPESTLDDVRDYLAWCLRQAQKGRIVRLVAKVDGRAVGNVQLTIRGQRGEVGSLIVAEAYRRRGLARRMLEEVVALAQRRGLAVLEIAVSEQQAAILAFYQQLGFQRVPDTKEELSHPASPEPIVNLEKRL